VGAFDVPVDAFPLASVFDSVADFPFGEFAFAGDDVGGKVFLLVGGEESWGFGEIGDDGFGAFFCFFAVVKGFVQAGEIEECEKGEE
jgi:hypothetical protein